MNWTSQQIRHWTRNPASIARTKPEHVLQSGSPLGRVKIGATHGQAEITALARRDKSALAAGNIKLQDAGLQSCIPTATHRARASLLGRLWTDCDLKQETPIHLPKAEHPTGYQPAHSLAFSANAAI